MKQRNIRCYINWIVFPINIIIFTFLASHNVEAHTGYQISRSSEGSDSQVVYKVPTSKSRFSDENVTIYKSRYQFPSSAPSGNFSTEMIQGRINGDQYLSNHTETLLVSCTNSWSSTNNISVSYSYEIISHQNITLIDLRMIESAILKSLKENVLDCARNRGFIGSMRRNSEYKDKQILAISINPQDTINGT